MKSHPRFLSVCWVLLALLTLLSMSAAAQDAPGRLDPFTTTTNVSALRAEAIRAGSIRVIVGVRADTNGLDSLNRLDPAQADAQRRRISRDAQATVLSSLRDAGLNATVQRRFWVIPFMTLTVNAAALDALAANPLVTSIENDALAAPAMSSSAGVIGASGPGGAWDLGYTGEGFAVAVLDTGVDKNHPALSGRVISEACYNTTDAFNESSSLCPGGAASSTASGSGADCTEAVAIGCEHGSHVAGTVASTDATHRGIAYDASIIAINVFSLFAADSGACGGPGAPPCVLAYTTDQIAGLERVYALRDTFDIASVNMSLGGGQFTSEATCDANNGSRKAIIDDLRDVNIATVIASGNNGFTSAMGAPGCISTAISVGATTDNDAVASFSNSASFLELLAPGVSITSVKAGTSTFQTYEGTSMATPHVAAAWAVIRQADPDLTVTEVLNLLSTTGVSVTDTRGGAGNRVKPRIQLDAALEAILPDAPPAPTNLVATPDGPSQIDLTWDDVTGETGYDLEWSVDEVTWNVLGSTVADDTTFSDTGMNCDTTFYYRVFAVNDTLKSPASNTASATSEPCPTEIELLVNGNFEDNDNANLKLPDGWIGAGALLGDKVMTDGAVIRSYSAPNAFRFQGKPNETTSTIRRRVKLANFTFNVGDLLDFSAYIDQRTGKPNVIVGRAVIDYNGAAPNSVIKLRLPATATTGYVLVSAPQFTLTNTDIASITVYLQYKPSTGTSFFDDVSLKLIPSGAAVGARDGGIPLPAAPSELRGG